MRQPASKQETNGRVGVQEANRRGGASGQEAAERQEDKRRQRHNMRRRDNQLEGPAEPPPPPLPPSPPAGMAAPLARSLAMTAAATSPASSASLASAKSVSPPSSLLTPSHRRRHRPCRMRSLPFWQQQRPLPAAAAIGVAAGATRSDIAVIRNYVSPVHGVVCLCQVWNSLLTKGERIFLIVTICKYIFTSSVCD